MLSKEYSKYLLSKEWAEIKNDLYNVRGKKCERCNSTKRVQVHHKHYRNIFHEEPKDLEILCDACHRKEHIDRRKSAEIKRVKNKLIFKKKHKKDFGFLKRQAIKYFSKQEKRRKKYPNKKLY